MSGNTVVVTKFINATREDLFEAFTNPNIMSKYYDFN